MFNFHDFTMFVQAAKIQIISKNSCFVLILLVILLRI